MARCLSLVVDLVPYLVKCLVDPARAQDSALCMFVREWVLTVWDQEDQWTDAAFHEWTTAHASTASRWTAMGQWPSSTA